MIFHKQGGLVSKLSVLLLCSISTIATVGGFTQRHALFGGQKGKILM
jgi:hypothetical protein